MHRVQLKHCADFVSFSDLNWQHGSTPEVRWGKVTCFQESRHPSTAEQFAAFSATETCKHSVTCFLVVARGADSRRGMQLACRYCDAKCMDCGAIKRSLSKLLAECLVHHLLVGTYNGLFPCFHSSPTQKILPVGIKWLTQPVKQCQTRIHLTCPPITYRPSTLRLPHSEVTPRDEVEATQFECQTSNGRQWQNDYWPAHPKWK